MCKGTSVSWRCFGFLGPVCRDFQVAVCSWSSCICSTDLFNSSGEANLEIENINITILTLLLIIILIIIIINNKQQYRHIYHK